MAASYIRKTAHAAISTPKQCIACAGSGHYDDTGSPICSACGGTGLDNPPTQPTCRECWGQHAPGRQCPPPPADDRSTDMFPGTWSR